MLVCISFTLLHKQPETHSGYVYMHNFWFNRTEFIPIDESESSVYMIAK